MTRIAQFAALSHLRVAADRQHTMLRYQEKLIAKTINRKLKNTHPPTALAAPVTVQLPRPLPLTTSLPPASGAPSVDASNLPHTLMSPVEETMRRYQATPSADAPASFPVDPATNFQISYPFGFAGCMYCKIRTTSSVNGTPWCFYYFLFQSLRSQIAPSQARPFAP